MHYTPMRIVWVVRTDSVNGGYKTTDGKESYRFETVEWAQMCADHFNQLERVKDPFCDFITVDGGRNVSFCRRLDSEWVCYLFGGVGEGITWNPSKGTEPNWFWRKMQYIFFGNKWVKK